MAERYEMAINGIHLTVEKSPSCTRVLSAEGEEVYRREQTRALMMEYFDGQLFRTDVAREKGFIQILETAQSSGRIPTIRQIMKKMDLWEVTAEEYFMHAKSILRN